MGWSSGNYVSGLTHKRAVSGRKINFRVRDGELQVGLAMPGFLGGWRENIPVSTITAAEIRDAERVSGARVLLTGGLGVFWKKHDRFLVLDRNVGGFASSIVLTARLPVLNKALSDILRLKMMAEPIAEA